MECSSSFSSECGNGHVADEIECDPRRSKFGRASLRQSRIFPGTNHAECEQNVVLRLRRKTLVEEIGVEQFFTPKSVWAALAKHPFFEGFTLFVISINAIWIGIDTDYNSSPDLRNADLIFLVMENFFCYYFTFEVAVRFLAFSNKLCCMKDFWFKFDSFLVLLMILETWILPLVMPDNSEGGGVGQLSILRLLRLLRLTRMARLMRSLPSLVIILKGMRAAAMSVASTLVLLIIVLYVFAIVMKMLVGNSPEYRKAFGTVELSMYNLFLGAILLDDATNYFNKLRLSNVFEARMCFYVMLFFILISTFTIMNMLLGVLCEVAAATKIHETQSADWNVATDILTEAFQTIDEDKTGTVSEKEFRQMTEKAVVREAFEILSVEPEQLLQLSDAIFEAEPGATEEVELSFAEFLDVVWSNRPGMSASVLDLVQMQKTLRRSANRVAQIISRLEHCLLNNVSPLPLNEAEVVRALEQQVEKAKLEAERLTAKQEEVTDDLADLIGPEFHLWDSYG